MGKSHRMLWLALYCCCLILWLTACGPAADANANAAGSRLHVVRTGMHMSALDITVTDSTQVARLRTAIDALAQVAPDQVLHCPLDTGTVYTLTFTHDGGSPEVMTFNASGCQLLTVKKDSDVRFTTGEFRSLFSQLTGISPLDAPVG